MLEFSTVLPAVIYTVSVPYCLLTYLILAVVAVVNVHVIWTVDVHADMGADIAGQRAIIFLPSISATSTHSPVCRPYSQDADTGMLLTVPDGQHRSAVFTHYHELYQLFTIPCSSSLHCN